MISDAKLQKALDWLPHANQNLVLKSKENRIVLAAGVRFGKSSLCAYVALKVFLEGLADIKKGKRDSIKIWIVAPSYELSKKVFEYVVKWFLKIHPESAGSVSYRPYPQIKLAEGVWVQGKSATEPHSLLGEELDLLIIDEAAVISPDIWETYLSARLISRNGRAIFISTPFGQNWFYREFEKCKETNSAFHFTTLDNPTLSQGAMEQIKKLEKELPRRIYLQNYEASFLPEAASIFPTVQEIVKDDCLRDAEPDRKYIMGVDLGRTEDYTVLCVIERTSHCVVYLERMKETFFPLQKTRIKAIAQRYNNARIIVDSSGVGLPISEDLQREGLFVITDFKFSGKSKPELVEKGIVEIEQKDVWIPPDEISGVPLVSELKAFGYNLTESGNVTYSSPQGLHDDCVIAFLLAVWGIQGKIQAKQKDSIFNIPLRKKEENFI